MPTVSRKQQKAMYAAKEGNSTLGIPQKVGAEFIAADKKRDTRPRAHQYARDHDEFHTMGTK